MTEYIALRCADCRLNAIRSLSSLDTENPDPAEVSAEVSSAIERLRSLAAAAFGEPARHPDHDPEPEQQGAGDAEEDRVGTDSPTEASPQSEV